MTSPTNISVAGEDGQSLEAVMAGLGAAARRAARMLARTDALEKDEALEAMAGAIEVRAGDLMAANAVDVAAAQTGGMSPAFVDRLTLTPERIAAMSAGLRAIAAFNDPVGSVIAAWEQPNGLKIERVRTPLGVIGVIFESRPNVTVDAGGLCLKAGNAAILRGGSDSWHSTRAIHQCLVAGLNVAGLPEAAIQLVPTRDREAVGMMLSGLNGAIDVIVPRGGRSLVERVQNDARVPVFAHLEGICHLYVHPSADLAMAVDLALNSKLRRTGICGALECLLIDRGCVETHLKPVVMALLDAGCEVRGDQTVQTADPRVVPAHASDWGHEFLDAVVAVKVVDNVHEACSHIESYGSAHTDAIVAEDETVAATFFEALDSAILLHNASTQFADGGEFGMGAEIGIATGKFHARGPVGVEQLTSFQYRVYGDGQTRT